MKIPLKNPTAVLIWHKENKVPYKLIQSTNTKTIISEYGEFKFINKTTELKFNDLLFINKVKRHCEKLTNIPNVVKREGIRYIQQGKLNNKILYRKELFEIDLKGAYWEFSLKNKFIEKDLYNEGLKVKKVTRLIALGNLAKRTIELNFNGDEYVGDPIFTRSDITENVFFKVSQDTDLIMRNLICIAGAEFLFYWCDAIFVQGENVKDAIVEFLQDNNILFKVVDLKKVIKNDNKISVTDDENNLRPFLFKKYKPNNIHKLIEL